MTDRHDPYETISAEGIHPASRNPAIGERQSRVAGRGWVELARDTASPLWTKSNDALKAIPRAVGYCRVGTTAGASAVEPVSEQRKAIESYCASRGWLLTAVYIEVAPGATVDQRPAFQAMMNDSCQTPRPFENVIAYSPSRISRDATSASICRNVLHERGIDLVFVEQPAVGMIHEMAATVVPESTRRSPVLKSVEACAAIGQQRSRELHRIMVELARDAARALAPVKP